MSQVVVTGSIAFDQIANYKGKFCESINPKKLHVINLSFLVDTLRVEEGGTGGNIAYSLALLGCKPRLVGSVGKDAKDYAERLKNVGVDVGGVGVVKERTAMGYVTTDKQDNQIWAFYKGAMEKVQPIILTGSDPVLVVIAPNEPKAMVEYVNACIKNKWDFLYDPAFQIPVFKTAELRQGVKHAKMVIGNDYEVSLLRDRIQESGIRNQDDQIWITTLGAKGCLIEQNGKKIKIKAAKPENTSDPTGAGDAFRAGFVAGYLKGLDLKTCGQMGSVCSVYTVEKYGTQTHKFSLSQFKRRYKLNYKKDLLY